LKLAVEGSKVAQSKRRLFETDYEEQILQHQNELRQAQSRLCSTIDKPVFNFASKIKVDRVH
jgi:hypothetical protein